MNWQSGEDEQVARALDGALPRYDDRAGLVVLAERLRELSAEPRLDADPRFRDALRARLLAAGAALLPRPRLPGDAGSPAAAADPTGDPTGAAADPTSPAAHPTGAAADPTNPAAHPTDPTNPAADPTNPAADPTNPVADPTGPAADPTGAAADPADDPVFGPALCPAAGTGAGPTGTGAGPTRSTARPRRGPGRSRPSRHASSGPPARPGTRSPRRRQALAAGALVVAALSASTVALSGDALPGDPLYGVKRTMQGVDVAMPPSAVDRGHRHLEVARTRVQELDTAGVSTAPGPLLSTLNDMDAETREGVRLLSMVAVRRTDDSRLTELAAWTSEQRSLLAAASARLPAVARSRAAESQLLLGTVSTRLQELHAALHCQCPAATPLDLRPAVEPQATPPVPSIVLTPGPPLPAGGAADPLPSPQPSLPTGGNQAPVPSGGTTPTPAPSRPHPRPPTNTTVPVPVPPTPPRPGVPDPNGPTPRPDLFTLGGG